MPTFEEEIKAIEDEIRNTKYNKATAQHIGRLKAKLARIKDEAVARAMASSGTGEGYSVKKSGDGTVVLVGFPSVGKSTLLNKITGAESETANYAFTTLTVVPGAMEHKGANIQILDIPGLIAGAAMGKGRGKEVIGVVRAAGGEVVGVGSVVDRSGGKADFGVPFHALMTLEATNWKDEDCPLCKEGVPIVKPGSRKVP